MATNDLVGTADAARLLDCSPRTVHRLVEDGTLKPAHVASGGRAGIFLFDRDDVEVLARARESRAASA